MLTNEKVLLVALCGAAACNGGFVASSAMDDAQAPPADRADAAVIDDAQATVGPTRPLPAVYFEPVDRTTSVSATMPLHVVVSNLGAPVGAGLLQDIAAAFWLRTWPELDEVPIAVSQIVDTSGRSGEDQYAHIYFTPEPSLADRWYAFGADVLPMTAVWSTWFAPSAIMNSGRSARFRIGSAPMLWGMQVIFKDPTTQAVYIHFSEAITGDASAIQLSSAGGGGPRCQPTVGAVIVSGDAASLVPPPDAASEVATATVPLRCTGVDLDDTLFIDIHPGLRSTSGVLFNGGAPLHVDIAPSAWRDSADGGKVFTPAWP